MNTYSDCDLYRHLFIQDLSNRFQLKKKSKYFFFVRDEDELENQNLKQNINDLKQQGLRLHTLDNLSVFQTPKKVIFQNLCYEEQCGLALYNVIESIESTWFTTAYFRQPLRCPIAKKVRFQNLCYEDQRGLAVYNVIQLNQHGLRLHTLDNLSVVHAPKKNEVSELML